VNNSPKKANLFHDELASLKTQYNLRNPLGGRADDVAARAVGKDFTKTYKTGSDDSSKVNG
jgi:hypothetical protein